MNNRIRELAEQAGYIDKGSNHTTYRDFNHEKFAELIIAECADVGDSGDPLQDGGMGKMIREHFGVE